MVSTYYELLGVEPDASKDEIRAAYRVERERSTDQARRSQLNRAWNVLSDPVQRQRYDATLADGAEAVATEEDGGPVVDRAPDRRRTGRSSPRGSGPPGREKTAGPGASRPTRPRPEPTVVLPEGVRLAEGRLRGLALLFDVSVLAVLYFLLTSVVPPLVVSGYSAKVSRYNREIKAATNAQSRRDKAAGRASAARSRASSAEKRGDALAAGVARDQASSAQDQADRADAQRRAAEKRADRLANQVRPGSLGGLAAVVAVSLLYLVPMTALTGQTLGMRLRRLRVVRVDGAPVGWGPALVRFLLPLVVFVALGPQLGLLLGLGLVLWFLRDRNRQGIHDRMARTLVVEA